ncbi:uncharacterized protein LOC113146732, partial [Cyclospora cayetanensis]|uniref:Uncharacterized protein LOC113146732 n=1 Tax=Cyclospora cayetanensis TaxID=88456 RepID=A0A6P6RTB1_9EIME
AAASAATKVSTNRDLFDALCLLSSQTAAAAAALQLLPTPPGPLSAFQGPLADAWFLGYEVHCCRLSLSPYQVQQRLQGLLGTSFLRAWGGSAAFYFMSYGESRVSLLQQAFPHQNPHCIAAAAEGLRGSNLPVIDAVGLLLLLQVMHRRALQIYALYEQGPQKPLSHQFFIDILLGALSPAAAARATALEHTLKNQQRFVDLSFEDFGTLLLLASDDPLRALPLPEKGVLNWAFGGIFVAVATT